MDSVEFGNGIDWVLYLQALEAALDGYTMDLDKLLSEPTDLYAESKDGYADVGEDNSKIWEEANNNGSGSESETEAESEIESESEEDYSISEFIEATANPKLSYHWHPTVRMRVFWSNNNDFPDNQTQSHYDADALNLKEQIRAALIHFSSRMDLYVPKLLVQFWLPTTIGGRRVLTTSDQPFGLSGIKRAICDYRKHCMRIQFSLNVGGLLEGGDELITSGGIIGRVFVHKQMQSTIDLSHYYPHQRPPSA